MPIALAYSKSLTGLQTVDVRVEADLANGLPNFAIVGLPSTAVREARDRVRAAIQNAGFEFPARRVTVNLAPADLPKDSGRFDLAIALAILAAAGQLPIRALERTVFAAELSLTGELLAIRAGFAWGLSALQDDQAQRFILPSANAPELALLGDQPRLLCAPNLQSVCRYLKSFKDPTTALPTVSQQVQSSVGSTTQAAIRPVDSASHQDLAWEDVIGQTQAKWAAKWAAKVAAAGGHSLLLFGPPGVGKSMIASRMAGLLPALSQQQAAELAAIQSLDGQAIDQAWRVPPYRAPHHSTPSRALVGGGLPIRPGELSLAHHGVLFLDELPEFSRDALESLREPMETGEVRIARVRERLVLPAKPMLVAAMNPCPCGYYGVLRSKRHCRCSPEQVQRYRNRLSGPLFDRFDLVVCMELPDVEQASLAPEHDYYTDAMRESVAQARERALARQQRRNAQLSRSTMEDLSLVTATAHNMLMQVAKRHQWSRRVLDRLLRVAHTVADLQAASTVTDEHMAMAIGLRRALDPPDALALE